MNKITTEFQEGQILHAADLNPLITSINQAADELATKAGQQDLNNTKQTANNALTTANNAATAAEAANTAAINAQAAAQTAEGSASQAVATAENAHAEAMRRLLMVEFFGIVENVSIRTQTATSVDAVCYNKTTSTFVARSGFSYYANWPNAQEYGSEQSSNGWEPREGVIYYQNGNIFIYDGASFWKTAMDPVI